MVGVYRINEEVSQKFLMNLCDFLRVRTNPVKLRGITDNINGRKSFCT